MAILRGYIVKEGGVPYSFLLPLAYQHPVAVNRIKKTIRLPISRDYSDDSKEPNRSAVVLFADRDSDFDGMNFRLAAQYVQRRARRNPIRLEDFLIAGDPTGTVPPYAKVNLALRLSF